MPPLGHDGTQDDAPYNATLPSCLLCEEPVTATDLRRHLESPAAFRVALGIYAVALALGLKRFLVWDQILVLEGAGVWPVFSSLHPHAFRWLVMQPALAFGNADIPPDAAFTVICFGLVWATTVLLARAGSLAAGKVVAERVARESSVRVWLFLPLALATLTMNGRLIPAFAGLALLTALHVDQAAGIRRHLGWLITGQLVGLLLMSVSSGTFAVGIATVAWSWLTMIGPRWSDPAIRRVLLPLAIALGAGVGVVGLALAWKAVGFFHGHAMEVLDHGLGGQFARFGVVPAIIGCFATIAAAILFAWRGRFPAPYGSHLRVPIAASLVLGLIGYATLTTALPLLLLMGVLAIVETPSK